MTSRDWIDHLCREHRPLIKRRVERFIRDKHHASSVVQDVFLRLWKGEIDWRARSEGEKKSLMEKVIRSASIQHIRFWRRKKRHPETGLERLSDAVQLEDESSAEAAELRATMNEMFNALGDDVLRQVAFLHWIWDCTLEEIAVEVGLTVSKVRTRLTRIDAIWKRFEK